MKFIILLLLFIGCLSQAIADEIPCPLPQDIVSSNLSVSDFRDICNEIVDKDPGCLSIKPELRKEKMMNCDAGPEANRLLSSDSLAAKAWECVVGVWDSVVDIGKFIVELISNLVDSRIKNITDLYKFMADEKFRTEALAKLDKAPGENMKVVGSFLRMTAAYFAQEFNKNMKDSYYNPVLAVPKTLLGPLVKFVAQTAEGMVDSYMKEYHCLNGPAKAASICPIITSVLVPPAALFAYLKGGKAALLMMKNMKKGKGVVESAKRTHDSLVVLKASKKLRPQERIAESKRVLDELAKSKGRDFVMDEKKADAIMRAHKVGYPKDYFEYTPEEIAEKARILKQAGFKVDERRLLMDRGLTGGASEMDFLNAAKEANLKALSLAVDVTKTINRTDSMSTSALKVVKEFQDQLKLAAKEYQSAAVISRSPSTLSKSWMASLKAGDPEAAYLTAKKGIKEFNMSPNMIIRSLRENYDARLLKAKDAPNDPILAMELKGLKELEERLVRELPPPPVPAPAPSLAVKPTTPAPAAAAPKPAPAATPVAPPKPAPAPSPVAQARPAAPSSNLRPPQSVTPREAEDIGHSLRLKREYDTCSEYFMRAAKKRALDDKNFRNAFDESMKGEAKVALDIIRESKKDSKLLNEILVDMHDEELHFSKNAAVKANLKKIVDEINTDRELKDKLYMPQIRMLETLTRWTR